jgi:hypothetical protein
MLEVTPNIVNNYHVALLVATSEVQWLWTLLERHGAVQLYCYIGSMHGMTAAFNHWQCRHSAHRRKGPRRKQPAA